jgi:hypothetical protein
VTYLRRTLRRLPTLVAAPLRRAAAALKKCTPDPRARAQVSARSTAALQPQQRASCSTLRGATPVQCNRKVSKKTQARTESSHARVGHARHTHPACARPAADQRTRTARCVCAVTLTAACHRLIA